MTYSNARNQTMATVGHSNTVQKYVDSYGPNFKLPIQMRETSHHKMFYRGNSISRQTSKWRETEVAHASSTRQPASEHGPRGHRKRIDHCRQYQRRPYHPPLRRHAIILLPRQPLLLLRMKLFLKGSKATRIVRSPTYITFSVRNFVLPRPMDASHMEHSSVLIVCAI